MDQQQRAVGFRAAAVSAAGRRQAPKLLHAAGIGQMEQEASGVIAAVGKRLDGSGCAADDHTGVRFEGKGTRAVFVLMCSSIWYGGRPQSAMSQ